jgi:putative transposase
VEASGMPEIRENAPITRIPRVPTAINSQIDLWTYNHKVQMDFNRRGKPTDNATEESFNGKFREECLNAHWFDSIQDAKEKIDASRWDYNEHRPHRSLERLTPREFAVKAVS